MKAVFRVDASSRIGSGHVVRCLTLAEALQDRGTDCRFVACDLPGSLNDLIRKRGFRANVLPSPAGQRGWDWKEDVEATVTALEGVGPEWLVVDHYELDNRWESTLKAHCPKNTGYRRPCRSAARLRFVARSEPGSRNGRSL